jgi:glycosyltransferase involved in cell wall biosynthesis
MITLTGPENDYSQVLALAEPAPGLRVAVVLPVYNRVALLARAVAGLLPQTYPSHLTSVVVADDGSDEDVASAVERFGDRLDLTVVRRERDGYGAGQARNLGAAATDADVLVFIDADCIPDPDLVARHARWHHLADNLVVIGSRHGIDSSTIGLDQISAGSADLRRRAFPERDGRDDSLRPTDYRNNLYRLTSDLRHGTEGFRSLVSSNFSVRREHFTRVGGFAEEFHRWGGEDIELGWRLWNDALFFLPDNEALCYHQLQEDELGEEGREGSAALNTGLMSSKVPHHFYRRPAHGPIFEMPKVSWVITNPIDGRDEEMFIRLTRHHYQDAEVIFANPGPDTALLAESYLGDPRFSIARGSDADPGGLARAVRTARGEFVAVLDARASVDRRLLGRVMRVATAQPRVARFSVGYRVGSGGTARSYRGAGDAADIEALWSTEGVPPFAVTTRREWIKALNATKSVPDAWKLLTGQTRAEHLDDDMVTLPSEAPGDAAADLDTTHSSESVLRYELPTDATMLKVVGSLTRFAVARLRRRPMQPRESDRDRLHGAPKWRPPPGAWVQPDPPRVHYVGWTWQSNLGDDAMLAAAKQLLRWGDVAEHERAELLLLGGGTLINRSDYLEQLIRRDSPRAERAVFGTGVADPRYWGLVEPVEGWVRFLQSCCYVGLRGPGSLQTVRGWGYTGEAEVLGDPALSLTPSPDIGRDSDRVVVSPAWTGGELWGKDDRPVLSALAEAVRSMAADGREVVMMSCHPADDRHIFEMMRAAGLPELDYVAGYDDVAASIDLLASAGLVVSERLHGSVLAAAAATPFVAIEYRPKVRDFAVSVGMEDAVLRADAVSVSSLLERVGDVESRRPAVLDVMAEHVGTYRRRLRDAAGRLGARFAS